jgi:hypothetical protein
MTEIWYYTREGRKMDPISTPEIQRLVREGKLKPTDMVWREGMPRWVRASSAPEIFPEPTSALDRALAPAPDEAPVVAGNDEDVPLRNPIVVESYSQRPAEATNKDWPVEDSETPKPQPLVKRQPDKPLPRRRKKRDPTGMVILIGLFVGAGLLIVVGVLGMFFILLAAH